jgi:arylsulfatase A-like enzyme
MLFLCGVVSILAASCGSGIDRQPALPAPDRAAPQPPESIRIAREFPFADSETGPVDLTFDDPAQWRVLLAGWNDFTQCATDEPGCLLVGSSGVMEVPIVQPRDLSCTLQLAVPDPGKSKTKPRMEIRWNGRTLNTADLVKGEQEIALTIPASWQHRGPNRLEIVPSNPMPANVPPKDFARYRVRFREVRFSPSAAAAALRPATAGEDRWIQGPGTVATFYPKLPESPVLRGEGKIQWKSAPSISKATGRIALSLLDEAGNERIVKSWFLNDHLRSPSIELDEDLQQPKHSFLRLVSLLPGMPLRKIPPPVQIEWSGVRIEGATPEAASAAIVDATRKRYNVLIVLFDALRADHTSLADGSGTITPQIERLATEGAYFPRAFSQSSWTRTSVTTFMSSLYPWVHGVMSHGDKLPPSNHYLPEVLRQAGNHTTFIVNNVMIEPETWGFDRGFDRTKVVYQIPGYEAAEDRAEFVWKNILKPCLDDPGGVPFFLYLHELDPHDPYDPPAPFDRMYDPDYAGSIDGSTDTLDAVNKHRMEIGPADLHFINSLYRGETSYMDRFLGHILDYLKDSGLAETPLVVFLADHGEEFMEHGRLRHAQSLYEEVLHVPFIFSLQGVIPPGVRPAGTARLIDLPPTILDLLGLEIPAEMQGRSLLPEMLVPGEEADEQPAFANLGLGDHDWLSVRYRNWKLIGRKIGDRFRRWFLYDLQSDPGEQINLWGSQPAVGKGLRRLLEIRMAKDRQHALAPPDIEPIETIPEEQMEALRAMGYLD